MTEREKIIALAKKRDPGFTGEYSDELGASLVGLEAIERFYHAAQAEAFEQAAKLCEAKDERFDGYQYHLATPKQCADAIRQLGKGKS